MEEKTLKINNLEFNCQTLIEFSSLINALLEMAKKQKETEKKLGEQEIKINNLVKLVSNLQKEQKETGIGWQDKENEISNILNDEHIFSMNYNNSNLSNYINNETLNDAPKQSNNNLISDKIIEENEKEIVEEKDTKEANIPEKETQKEKKIANEENIPSKNIDDINKDEEKQNQISIKDKINNFNQKIAENQNQNIKEEEIPNTNIVKNINDTNNNIITSTTEKKPYQEQIIVQKHSDKSNKNTEIISKLFQRIIVLEKKVAELMSKSNDNMIIRTITTNKQNLKDQSNSIKKLKEITDTLNKDVSNLKESMKDFNIYDMFKDGGDGNVDITKALIKALETKQNKRFELMDEKYKLMSTESFKNKDDIKNLGIVIDGQKKSLEKSNNIINKIIEEQKEKEIKHKELQETEKTELNKKFEDVNNNLDNLEKNYDNKLLELESKLSSQNKQPLLVTDLKQDKKKEKRNNELLNMIKEYNERILELEKSMRQLLKKINIEEINSNLSILQKEVSKKGNQGAIDEMIDRVYTMD